MSRKRTGSRSPRSSGFHWTDVSFLDQSGAKPPSPLPPPETLSNSPQFPPTRSDLISRSSVVVKQKIKLWAHPTTHIVRWPRLYIRPFSTPRFYFYFYLTLSGNHIPRFFSSSAVWARHLQVCACMYVSWRKVRCASCHSCSPSGYCGSRHWNCCRVYMYICVPTFYSRPSCEVVSRYAPGLQLTCTRLNWCREGGLWV